MNYLFRYLFVLILISLLGCRSTPPDAEPVDAVPMATSLPASPTPTQAPDPTITPRPSPTPIMSHLFVQDQAISETAVLLVDEVVITEPGWIVVFNSVDGEPDAVIGVLPLSFGVSDQLEIAIDLAQASETLVIQLFAATDNTTDAFELEEATPLSPQVIETVDVTLDISHPEIVVTDQAIGYDGHVIVDSVLSNEAGWLLVHNMDGDEVGTLIGVGKVEKGLSEQVAIPVRWREAVPTVQLSLVADNGRLDVYEPEEDTPIVFAQEPVEAMTTLALPVDVIVFDQPLANGLITVDRVSTPADGWLAVYQDEEGVLGLIIGYAPIKAGINERVTVDVIDGAITDPLYVVLHEDTNKEDEFDLPANDRPFTNNGDVIPPFPFRVISGDFLVTQDQPLQTVDGETGVAISLLSVQFSTWVVVQTVDEDGMVDEIVSQTAVSGGIYRDFFVPIPETFVGEQVVIALYANSGDPELFELEEAIDLPLRLNLQNVQIPLHILAGE